ncbi:MAG: NlpC/P60 family protein [Armatimonadota bacterium]
MQGLAAAAVIAALTITVVAASPSAAAQSQRQSTAIHHVQRGDTLWSLARRYGTTPERLAGLNGISTEAVLSIGRPLKLPGRPATASATGTYRVQAGDTLWSIARRRGTRPERLAEMNRISAEAILSIGQELHVPVSPGAAARPALRTGRSAASPAFKADPSPARPATRARLAALPSRGAKWFSTLVTLSQRHLGARYRWGGTSPSGFDCSGFLYYVFGRMELQLPRTTYAMFAAGVPVPRESLQTGDIVFFQTLRPGPSHAGIYLGDGQFIHSSSGAGRVLVTGMDHRYYAPRYLGARRF